MLDRLSAWCGERRDSLRRFEYNCSSVDRAHIASIECVAQDLRSRLYIVGSVLESAQYDDLRVILIPPRSEIYHSIGQERTGMNCEWVYNLNESLDRLPATVISLNELVDGWSLYQCSVMSMEKRLIFYDGGTPIELRIVKTPFSPTHSPIMKRARLR